MRPKPADQPTNRPASPRRVELTPEQLKRIQKAKAADEAQKIEPEYYVMAEFGYYFGYEGIRAIVNNELELGQVNQLIMASRKIWIGQQADIAQAAFIASASAQAKKPTAAFKKAVKYLRKAAKI